MKQSALAGVFQHHLHLASIDGYKIASYRDQSNHRENFVPQEQLPPLTLSEPEMRQIMGEVGDMIVAHFVGLKELAVTKPSTLEALRAGLEEAVPQQPTPVSEILKQLQTYVFSEMTHQDHPRNFAFVPGPSNFVGAMADAIASALNVFCGVWIGPSGTAQLELTTIEWLRQLFDFPQSAGGLFVSGGSMANLTCLAVARHQLPDDERTRAVFYFSDQTHSSVAKGMRTLGFQPAQLHKVKSDADYQLPMSALSQAMDQDLQKGMKPWCIIANAGTTNTGAVDPLNEIADLCAAKDLWMHVDGAYGASAALTQGGKATLSGINRADSLTIDPHKWMFQPYEIGCALIRDKHMLNDTFRVSAEYLKIAEHSGEQPNFSDYGVQLTRSFRALKLWMSLKAFGIEAFKAAIETGIRRAEEAEARLRLNDRWEIITPAKLGVVTFRYHAQGLSGSELDHLAMQMADGLIASGFAMLSPTILSGKSVLRMCTINPRTTREDVTETIRYLEDIAAGLLA